MQQIGAGLRRVPAVHDAAVRMLQTAGIVRRPRLISGYLQRVAPGDRCLVIGSGAMALDGWLNTDLVPVGPSIVYLDATRPWPLPADSFRYILCEHMIEQVPYESGLHLLAQARRVLSPGGVLRISTPDLDFVRSLPDADDPDIRDYVCWSNRTFGSPAEKKDPANANHVLNRLMREWGHTYLYDEGNLRHALVSSGFYDVEQCGPGASRHPRLSGVDRHGVLIGEVFNRIESLIVEATA